MDKLTQYQQIIEKTLIKISQMLAKEDDYESLLSIDHIRGQYILMSDGWEDGKRHYQPIIHLETKPNAEIWLRCDNTDLEVGQDLVSQGVSLKDIQLAFYSPQMRKYAQKALA
jgi:hypothetical protein